MKKLIPALLMIAGLVYLARKVKANIQTRVTQRVNQLPDYKI